MDLSVIVITRNEEAAIGACLESVLEHTEGLDREIILVDSASTDRTVEIAGRYPVKIVRIDSCSRYTPAAGRYVGTSHASGRYILFLDGDNVLIDGWIEGALAAFEDKKVAAVAGRIYVVLPGEELTFDHPPLYAAGTAKYLPTAGMYRRAVLQQVGTFNPFVRGEEERELAFRITSAGFAILRQDAPMAYHLMKPRTKSEQDEKAGYFTGVGQIFRHYGPKSITWDLMKAQKKLFLLQALFFAWIFTLAASVILAWDYLLYITLIGAVLLLTLLGAMKGWVREYLFFRGEALRSRNIVKGFFQGIRPAGQFRATTSIVQALDTGAVQEEACGVRQDI
jgi:glycosyltransferase involved in cell wall biosynthesis